MNLQVLGNRVLLLGPRFSRLSLSRCYAVKGMEKKFTDIQSNMEIEIYLF